jgi:TolB-like protein
MTVLLVGCARGVVREIIIKESRIESLHQADLESTGTLTGRNADTGQ